MLFEKSPQLWAFQTGCCLEHWLKRSGFYKQQLGLMTLQLSKTYSTSSLLLSHLYEVLRLSFLNHKIKQLKACKLLE